MAPQGVNSDLLAHLQKRLDDALSESGALEAKDTGDQDARASEGQQQPKQPRSQRKLESVEYEPDFKRNVEPEPEVRKDPELEEKKRASYETEDSGLKKLMAFFEDKLSDPIYSDEDMYQRRKELYVIFEESIQKALISTKRSGKYDDFPELTILYFIYDSDRQGYTVEEINSLVQEVS